MPRGPVWYAFLAVIAAAAIAVQLIYIPLHTKVFGLFNNQADLHVYRAGALRLLHDMPLYDAAVLGHFDYTYPPFSTVILSPLGWIGNDTAGAIWATVELLVIVGVVYAGLRSRGYAHSYSLVALTLVIALVSLSLEPVRTTIWYGQINLFLMAIVLCDLLRANGSRLRGIGVGLAAGIKLTPMFFAAYLVVTRRWRALVWAVAAAIATVAVGFAVIPRDSRIYWTDKVFDSQRVGFTRSPANQSIRGALAAIFHTEHPSAALWVLLCIVAVIIGLGAAWLAHRVGNELLALTLTGMTTTAVSPFSWGHHWVWFVPLLAVLADAGIRCLAKQRWLRCVAVIVGAVGLVLATFMWRTIYPAGVGKLKPFYGIGTFMNPTPDWLRWFAMQPYLWVFLVASVATIVTLWRTARPPLGHGTSSVPSAPRA